MYRALIIACFLAAFVGFYTVSDTTLVERTTALMGTEIQIIIETDDPTKAHLAIDAAFKEMKQIEVMMTDWNEESEFSQINRFAGIKPAKVSEEIIFLVEEAQKISELTEGKFDISYASAGKFWDFKKQPPTIPDPKVIKEAISKINYRNIVVDRGDGTVFLKHKDMRIGLGGIAKGYAVDRAIAKIEAMGFKNFTVNAGGDLTVRGKKNGKLWWASISDPRDRSNNVAFLPVSNSSIVTSGDYERYFEIDGKRYCHIIDPDTGYPADQCQSVTILAKKAYWADALATGIFVLGPEKGMELIEGLEGVEGMIIGADGVVHVSVNLRTK